MPLLVCQLQPQNPHTLVWPRSHTKSTRQYQVGIWRTVPEVFTDGLRTSQRIGIAGRVNPAILGYGTFAFTFVEAGGSALEAAQLLSRRRETAFVVAVGGSAGLIAEFRCRDTDHLVGVMGEARRELGSADARVAILQSYYKHDWSTFHSGVAVTSAHDERWPYRVDDVDMDILKVLAGDGRARFAEVARRVSVSQGRARQRVRHMVQTGVVTVQTVVSPGMLGLAGYAAVGVSVAGPAEGAAQQMAQMAPVAIVATVLGSFDIVVEVGYRDLGHLLETLDGLRSVPGVTQVESFPYLAEVKESMEAGLWPQHPSSPSRRGSRADLRRSPAAA